MSLLLYFILTRRPAPLLGSSQVMYPLSKHFDSIGIAKQDYGQCKYFNHTPSPRPTSHQTNCDIFRNLKPSLAQKQQNAQLKKIKTAKEVAEGTREGKGDFSLKIKGFAKSLPKTIEGGRIVSEVGWRDNLRRRKEAERNSASHQSSQRSKANTTHTITSNRGTPSRNSFNTNLTEASQTEGEGTNTLKVVLNMLACLENKGNAGFSCDAPEGSDEGGRGGFRLERCGIRGGQRIHSGS